MKVIAILAAVLAVAFAHPHPKAPLHAADSPTAVEGQYLIVFKKTAEDDAIVSHMALVKSQMSNLTKPDQELKVTSEWRIGKDFRGYAATMTDEIVECVRGMAEVAFVERNQEVKALQGTDCMQQTGLATGLWGLQRTTLREFDNAPERVYSYDADKSGEGIEAFVIDTGIEFDHDDFEGRIDKDKSMDFIESNGDGTDFNGHGTHCTGTVLGNKYGLAKKATGVAVRVLNANGSGTYEQVISGIEYTGNTGTPNKSVANMSLGGGFSTAVNAAVTAAINQGVHFALAAGNDGGNACQLSPASTPEAVTVGATDNGDFLASFSSRGDCVDILAPGVAVLSAYLNNGEAVLSGTSMASPHVAGVMVKLLAENGEMTPAAMKSLLQSMATSGAISGVPSNTPNLLLFDECL